MTYDDWQDSSKSNDVPLRGKACTHARVSGAENHAASFNGNGDGFLDIGFTVCVMRKRAVGFDDHSQRLTQVSLCFFQCATLSVDAGDLFYISQMPATPFHIDCGKLSNHTSEYSLEHRLPSNVVQPFYNGAVP